MARNIWGSGRELDYRDLMVPLGPITAKPSVLVKKGVEVGDGQERRLKLEREVRVRLESICSNLTEAEFQKLIEKIAENSINADVRSARFGYEHRAILRRG